MATPAEIRAKVEHPPPEERSQPSSQSGAAVDSIRTPVSANLNWVALAIAVIALLVRLFRG
jgi:hypothetical protein